MNGQHIILSELTEDTRSLPRRRACAPDSRSSLFSYLLYRRGTSSFKSEPSAYARLTARLKATNHERSAYYSLGDNRRHTLIAACEWFGDGRRMRKDYKDIFEKYVEKKKTYLRYRN